MHKKYEIKSRYNSISVEEDLNIRYLMFDGGLYGRQGGVYMNDPRRPVFGFQKALMDLAQGFNESSRILFIGLGTGFVPKEFVHYSGCKAETVEIDEAVKDIAIEHFDFPFKDIPIYVADGYDFVVNSKEQYDAIIVDAFSSKEIPFQLLTKEFFDASKKRLTPDGLFAIDLYNGHACYHSHLHTLMNTFGDSLYCNRANLNDVVYTKRLTWKFELPPIYTEFPNCVDLHPDEIFMNERIKNSPIFSLYKV